MDSTANEHLELGKQKFYKYDREGALDEFRFALSIDSNNPNILGWIAISLVVLERFEEAGEFLEKVQNEGSPEINIAKGTISYFNHGNHKTAINYYNEAISMDRNNLLGYVSRGILYARLNKGTDAISDFEKALRINKSSYVYCW